MLYHLSYVSEISSKHVERETGLEPATPSLEGSCSSQLSYSRPIDIPRGSAPEVPPPLGAHPDLYRTSRQDLSMEPLDRTSPDDLRPTRFVRRLLPTDCTVGGFRLTASIDPVYRL